jgi:hypothetical protein
MCTLAWLPLGRLLSFYLSQRNENPTGILWGENDLLEFIE